MRFNPVIRYGILAIAALFLTLEIALRLYKIADPAFVIMPDDTYLRYRGKPHSLDFNGFRINSRGFKDIEFPVRKQPGMYRIIGIGDSYTYGAVPYDFCYMTLLRKRVQRSEGACEVLNLGVPAAGPVDYLSILVNEGLSLEPDMVLVNIFSGDDFNNGGRRFKLYSFSKAATFVNGLLANWRMPEGRIFGSGEYRDTAPLRSEESYMQYLSDIESRSFYKHNLKLKEEVRGAVSYLEEIKRICGLKRIALAVVICPTELQWNPVFQKKLIQKLNKTSDDFDFRLSNRIVAQELNRLGIRYLDLSDFFSRAYQKERRSFNKTNDPHWNLYGNRTGAELVGPWLAGLIRQEKSAEGQN